MNAVAQPRRPLPEWISRLLANPPAAGTGIHAWLYHCACKLIPWRSPEESLGLLRSAAARCSRTVPDREITDAVQNARSDWHPNGVSRGLRLMVPPKKNIATAPRWPAPDWPSIARVAEAGTGLADLWEASPMRLEGGITTADYLAALFPGDPLLCMAKSEPKDAQTLRLSSWKKVHPDSYALIVPSPMSAVTGKRQDGKTSHRCLDNTGPRRFLVVEFDFKAADRNGKPTPAAPLLASLAGERDPRTAPDLCAALLLHLVGGKAPLALAVYSGGKSVHGWFPVTGASDATLRRFFAEACRLGADPATWCRCQLVRVPGGTRIGGIRQQVHYFNPAEIPALSY